MHTFDNLVFEGGGVWGIAYEGALAELEAQQAVDFGALKRVGGASAGAITACLLAVGYAPDEIGKILKDTKFSKFQDQDFGYARDTARLLTEYGWYKGDAFLKWLRTQIAEGIKKVNTALDIKWTVKRPTFSDLAHWHSLVSAKGQKLPALYVVGSNLSSQNREIYSAEHSGSLRIEDAVRRSMSIPIFFACARGDKRDVIVDGGLTWNYPVNIFDHTRYIEPENDEAAKPIAYAKHEDHVFNTRTLGFRLDTTREIEWNLKDWASEPMQIDNIIKYGWALVCFMRGIANKVHLHKNDWSRTVFIDVGSTIGFTDFDLTKDQQAILVEAGQQGVRKYLDWRKSPEGQAELARIYQAMQAGT